MADEYVPTAAEVALAKQKFMDAAGELIAEVKSQYRTAALKVGFSPDNIASIINPVAWGVYDWLFDSSQQDTIEYNMKQLGKQIAEWADHLSWVEKGKRDNGTAYDAEQWADAGKVYVETAQYYASAAWDYSLIFGLGYAVRDTAREYLELAAKLGKLPMQILTPSEWPFWIKASIAGIGLFLAWNVYRDFRPAVRAASDSARRRFAPKH